MITNLMPFLGAGGAVFSPAAAPPPDAIRFTATEPVEVVVARPSHHQGIYARNGRGAVHGIIRLGATVIEYEVAYHDEPAGVRHRIPAAYVHDPAAVAVLAFLPAPWLRGPAGSAA